MPKLINREAQPIATDPWQGLPRVALPADTSVPAEAYILDIDNTLSIATLEHELLNRAAGIALHFPAFTDGRAYSQARELRQRGYIGEIRAVGEVLADQLLAMRRCGFSSFELVDEHSLAAASDALAAFTHAAQPAVDNHGMTTRRLGSAPLTSEAAA